MITLFHAPMSRSGSIVWLLEELGVPYETKIVGIRRADGSGARDPVNPHPHAKVPLLVDADDLSSKLALSGSILRTNTARSRWGRPLANRSEANTCPGSSIARACSSPRCSAAASVSSTSLARWAWASADEVEDVHDRHLASRSYFLGDEFSAADVLVGGGINFLMMAKVLNETPTLKAYAARITDRPAFRRMMERDAKGLKLGR